jgi:hypothetical protein
MNGDVRQRIRDAAQAAFDHVWDTAHMPDGRSGALYAAMEGVEEHAADRYRQTVRDRCAEVGMDERAYWFTDPEEAAVFQPDCLTDLDTVRHQDEQDFVLTDPPF